MSTYVDRFEELVGARKVAALLLILGSDASSRLLGLMEDGDRARVAGELIKLRSLSVEVRNRLIEDTAAYIYEREGEIAGGEPFARAVLVNALGEEGAAALMEQLAQGHRETPFKFLARMDHNQIADVLSGEHPQTISVVLSHLAADQSAKILAALDPAIRTDVALRLATAEASTPQALRIIEDGLRGVLDSSVGESRATGGVKPLAQILNSVDASVEREIMLGLDLKDESLAKQVRDHMFTWDDIQNFDAVAMRSIVQLAPVDDLAMALRGATPIIVDKFFTALPSRVQEDIRYRMDTMGRVRLRSVNEAQAAILRVIREEMSAGRIEYSRSNEEQFIN